MALEVPDCLTQLIAQRLCVSQSLLSVVITRDHSLRATVVAVTFTPFYGRKVVCQQFADSMGAETMVNWEGIAYGFARALMDSYSSGVGAQPLYQPSSQQVSQQMVQSHSWGMHQLYSATMATSGMWPNPQSQQHPKRPRVGDPVFDTQGNLLGVYAVDGSVEPVKKAVVEAVQTITRDGVPVEPDAIRRAIRLSGKLSE